MFGVYLFMGKILCVGIFLLLFCFDIHKTTGFIEDCKLSTNLLKDKYWNNILLT